MEPTINFTLCAWTRLVQGAIVDVDLVGNPLVAAFLPIALLDYGPGILPGIKSVGADCFPTQPRDNLETSWSARYSLAIDEDLSTAGLLPRAPATPEPLWTRP